MKMNEYIMVGMKKRNLRDVVGGPDVGAILTSPVAGHMERVLVAGVILVATYR